MTRLQQELALQKKITRAQADLLRTQLRRLASLDVELTERIVGLEAAGYSTKRYEDLLDKIRDMRFLIEDGYRKFKNELNIDLDNARLDAFGLMEE